MTAHYATTSQASSPPTNSWSQIAFPIDLENVTRNFGSQAAVNALSLRIGRATTFGFVGLNGAGKTTAIRMMAGLLAPSAGSIRIMGHAQPAEAPIIKNLVGYVPDRPNVYSWMRIEQAIHFARSFYKTWNEARCQELLKLFKLDGRKQIKKLSKGQAAKVQLLLAICHDPGVLLLDEPTDGFDPLVREEFLEGVLAVTAQREQTVLFSSHSLDDVQRLADSIGFLHEGRLLLQSPVDELLDHTKRIHAVLDDANAPQIAPPGSLYQQRRGREWIITVETFSTEQVEFVKSRNRVSNVDVEDLSLDDVFKDILRGKQEAV